MILRNVIASLAEDLQNQVFLCTEIILSDRMYKTV